MNLLFKDFFKYVLFFLSFSPLVILANNELPASQYSIGLDLGAAKPTNLGSSTTFPVGYSTFSYGGNTSEERAVISGISINKLFAINSLYNLQLGASVHYISDMDVEGNLEQGISPPYYQANYSYSIYSYQYLVDAKLRRQFDRFFPYLYLGLGVATNKAHGYGTTVPSYLTVTPEYSNHTTNSFTYSLGLGVDYFVIPKLSIGCSYRFIDLGKAGLGAGSIRNTNVGTRLNQSNLYLNALLAQLNYFI